MDISSKEHLVDALVSRGDERRVRLRKVPGSCQQALIRKYLNGETHLFLEESYESSYEANPVN